MQKDALGLYDVYGVVYTPWWKTGTGLGYIFLLLIFLVLGIFFLIRFVKKYWNAVTDFDWCQIQIAYIEKELKKPDSEQNQELYFDVLMQVFKILFCMQYKQNVMSCTPQELEKAVQEHVQGEMQGRILAFIQSATYVRFGQASLEYTVIQAVEVQKQLIQQIQTAQKKKS
jgi:hypothetical protein